MRKNLLSSLETILRAEVSPKQSTDSATISSTAQAVYGVAALLAATPEESQRIASTQKVLANLRYDDMRARRSAVVKSHAGTYEWILDSSEALKASNVGFSEWLRRGQGIFWVSGKAGSRKSTLIKFLCNHSETGIVLQEWAGNAHIAIGDHFFWHTGHSLQKSQVGLLRAVLFDILRQ